MEHEYEENKAFLMEGIVSQVRFGFREPEMIIAAVCEQVEDEGWEGDFSENWVQERVIALYAERQTESDSWQHPTDTARLLQAFEAMRREKIVALHFAGYTQSDSLDDVAALYNRLRAAGRSPIGHCFYHEQDLERVIDDEGGELLLGFYGSDPEDEPLALQVGQAICRILQAQGFDVTWQNDLATRISIPDFRWQKVYTSEAEGVQWDHERIMELL